MNGLWRKSISTFALMVLAACAGAKPVAPAASNLTPAIPEDGASPVALEAGPGKDFAGLWYVSGVFPTKAAQASVADPHLGAALVIDAAEVSDVNGQRCLTPAFESGQTDAQAIGLKTLQTGRLDQLVVSCDGKIFATYVRKPGQSVALLQQRPEALYLLERAGQVLHRQPTELTSEAQTQLSAHVEPAPKSQAPAQARVEAVAAPAPAPVTEGPVAAPAEEPAVPVAKANATGEAALPAPGTAMHLASYKGERAAKRGWKILLGDNDELDPLSPLYVAVDVPGKGPIVRLYATGADRAQLTSICTALKSKNVYCTLNP